jgi:hypothetical protein
MKTNPPLPFKVPVLIETPVTVRNPLSGEKCELTPQAFAVYDETMKASLVAETLAPYNGDHPTWEIVRKGISWFKRYYPAEYMILLD